MTKFENVGRRDGPRTGGKARKDVSIIDDYVEQACDSMTQRGWQPTNRRRPERCPDTPAPIHPARTLMSIPKRRLAWSVSRDISRVISSPANNARRTSPSWALR
jgi:hypothetical protein